jgi:hypothetical protein
MTHYSEMDKRNYAEKLILGLKQGKPADQVWREINGPARDSLVNWAHRYYPEELKALLPNRKVPGLVPRSDRRRSPQLIQVPFDPIKVAPNKKADPNKRIIISLIDNVMSNLKTIKEFLED